MARRTLGPDAGVSRCRTVVSKRPSLRSSVGALCNSPRTFAAVMTERERWTGGRSPSRSRSRSRRRDGEMRNRSPPQERRRPSRSPDNRRRRRSRSRSRSREGRYHRRDDDRRRGQSRSRSRSRDVRGRDHRRERSPPRSPQRRYDRSPPRRGGRRSSSRSPPARPYGRGPQPPLPEFSPRRGYGRGPPPQREMLSDEPPAVGSIHHARVVSVRPFGAFVELPGFRRQALVHHTQISEDLHFGREDDDEMKVKAMEFFAPRGEKVWVKILEVRPEPGGPKLGASMRAASQEDGRDLDPDNTLAAGGARDCPGCSAAARHGRAAAGGRHPRRRCQASAAAASKLLSASVAPCTCKHTCHEHSCHCLEIGRAHV